VSASSEKYAELTNICAGNAATSIAQLLGASLHMAPPRCWEITDGRLPDDLFRPDERVTVVFAELEGGAGGATGLILRRPILEQMVQRLTGDDAATNFDERALSALCELGNIAVSAAANSLGEMLGDVVLPSVPRLGFEKVWADALLEMCGDLEGKTAYLVETELLDDQRPLRLLFAWVPAEA
jgi:chemotaxis protein CheC